MFLVLISGAIAAQPHNTTDHIRAFILGVKPGGVLKRMALIDREKLNLLNCLQ